jgi:hypothetical protein
VRRNLPVVVVAALLLAVAAPICAQSLAAVAKKEEDRRKNIKEPAKVYTNKDLRPAPPGSVLAPDASGTAAKEPDKDAAGKDAAGKDAAYWHEKMLALQTQADRDQTYLDAVQTRVNALTADFVNRDDPAQKAVIERERQRNLAELERLKKAIVDDKKAITGLEDEARRAGVPPGWLR